MRCAFYCISKEFDFKSLVAFLKKKKNYKTELFEDAVYINVGNIDFFLFEFGSLVIWGIESHKREKIIVEKIKTIVIDAEKKISFDEIRFEYDLHAQETYIDEEQNLIYLNNHSHFLKLSVSYALAQSVKLDILEDSILTLLGNTKSINKVLANNGKVNLSKKEISKKIGVLFGERYLINLHNDVLDTPEFFWKRPQYEKIYLKVASFEDIQERHSILNRRLDMIYDFYNHLSNELNYKHSSRLEMIIILLIAIETTLALCSSDTIKNFLVKMFKIFFS